MESWILITLLSHLGLFLFSRRAVVFFLLYSQIYKQHKYVYVYLGNGYKGMFFRKMTHGIKIDRNRENELGFCGEGKKINRNRTSEEEGFCCEVEKQNACVFFPTVAVAAAAPGAISLSWNHD